MADAKAQKLKAAYGGLKVEKLNSKGEKARQQEVKKQKVKKLRTWRTLWPLLHTQLVSF